MLKAYITTLLVEQNVKRRIKGIIREMWIRKVQKNAAVI